MPNDQQNEQSVHPAAGVAMTLAAAIGGYLALNMMNEAANGKPELMGNAAYARHGVNARYMLRSDVQKNTKGQWEVTYKNGNGHIPDLTFTGDDEDTLEKAILYAEREAGKLIEVKYGDFAKEYVDLPKGERPPRLTDYLLWKRMWEEQKLLRSIATPLNHLPKNSVYRALGL